MTRTLVNFMCVCTLLTGCVEERWVQAGKTDANVQEALVKCENSISPKVSAFADPIYTMPDTHSITKCMESHGYKLASE